ncbi:unnamed protein product [Paramecium sonneborni]|uniref:Transmembrane protein n=1 Tax=Paramecium sonneborni TaxID=65129 RepID=A0A8S1RSC9_9CILI|nr:unnamed protein product [Paramecium sonneborni]
MDYDHRVQNQHNNKQINLNQLKQQLKRNIQTESQYQQQLEQQKQQYCHLLNKQKKINKVIHKLQVLVIDFFQVFYLYTYEYQNVTLMQAKTLRMILHNKLMQKNAYFLSITKYLLISISKKLILIVNMIYLIKAIVYHLIHLLFFCLF